MQPGMIAGQADGSDATQYSQPCAAVSRMGAAFARDAPPLLQTLVATVLRTRLELALAGLDGAGKTTLVSVLQAPHDGAQAAAVTAISFGSSPFDWRQAPSSIGGL